MKFTVERDALLRALDHAQRIVVRQEVVPILNTVWIGATAGVVRIRATNLDMLAETTCSAEIEVGGEACVQLDPLFKLIQRLAAGSVVAIDYREGAPHVDIRCRRSAIELPARVAADFPDIPMPDGAAEVALEGTALARLLGLPAHAANPDDQRGFAQGVHLTALADDGMLCGIATSGLRMTRVLLPMPEGAGALPSVTIAVKPAAEIVKLAQAAGGSVRLSVTDNLLRASTETVAITTKLIECRYPNCRQFFPAEYTAAVIVATGELDGALNRALILADDRDREVKVEIADGSLSIAARSTKGGAVVESMDVEGLATMRFGTNARMIREALGVIGADVIELQQIGLGEPILMRARGIDDVVALVMPTRG